MPWGGEVVSILSDPALIEVLLVAGAEVNARTEHRQHTPLHLVAMNGADPAAMEALLAAGAEVDARDNEGATPLHSAAAYSRGEVVEALLAAGADPNARDAHRNTPLHQAVESLHHAAESAASLSVIQALVDAGTDPGARNDADETACDIAQQSERFRGSDACVHLFNRR